MGQNFLRNCSLSVNGIKIGGGGPTDLRVRFETISHTNQSLGIANFIVSNASPQTAAMVQQEGTKLVFSAGYGNSPGVIFSGSVTETQYGEREHNTDPLLRIWAADGDAGYTQGKISTTLASGATPQDIVDHSVKALQPFGISMGRIFGIDLSMPKFPRGYVLSGLVRDVLREVATSKGATFNLNGGQMNMIAKGVMTHDAPVVLNSTTGMLGQPIQRQNGIIVRCLINAAITVDGNVRIDQRSIVQTKFSNTSLQNEDANKNVELATQGVNDGIYRVLQVKAHGDTRGNDFEMELTCIGAITGSPNSTNVGEGLA